MAFDKDYFKKSSTFNSEIYKQKTDTHIISFIKETYKLFAASLLAGSAGGYIGMGMAASIQAIIWPLFFLEIGLLIGLHFVKNKPGINLIVMFAFTFISGLVLGPLLARVMGMSGGSTIIANAFAMTAIIFASLSYFAINTKKDFTSFGKPLLIALIVIIVGSLVNAFILNSPALFIFIEAGVVFLFSIYIIYDTQNIVRGNYQTPIEGAIALYLDFLNIFTALLQIFGIFGNSDD